ncbi:restriction endonuclease subunit S [Aeromonas veronii]|uniref:restriction endonuclease subunit S n=1 Tax=Aeromonas veronii TaxID=654 RepID=UPI003BA1E317
MAEQMIHHKEGEKVATQAIPTGFKQSEVGIIPEDWLVEPLENFTSFISYGFTNPMPTTASGPYMVTARDISNGKIQYDSARTTDWSAFHKLLTAKSKPQLDDVLLTKDGTLGRVALVENELICINQSVAILRPNKRIYPKFFKCLLDAPLYQAKMLEDAGGSTIKHIYITIVNKMVLGLPANLTEQTAIANVLSDSDALIDALEQLIAKKQAIKTASMQQLLTGRTRLPQFALRPDGTPKGYKSSELGQIPEDWESYSVRDIVQRTQLGGNYENTEAATNYPLIKMGNLGRGCINLDKIEFISGAPSSKDRLFFGDVLFNTRNTLDLVGKIAVWRNEIDEAYFNSNILRFDFNKGLVADHFFMNYAMNTTGFITQLSGIATGTTSVAAIYTRDLFSLKIAMPGKKEQTAIATILSDMDSELNALKQKLAKARDVKQGMMQQLLTGRIRLPVEQVE